MRLGIDMDGVICDFNAGWMARHRDDFGSDLAAIDTEIKWDNLHTLCGFADMEAFWRWAQGSEDRPSVFRHLEPFPGAVDTLRELAGAKHEIVIITAKPDWAVPDTLRWLADHEVPTREIHFRHRKSTVACDVYLDDSPLVLPELVSRRPAATVCRMVRPWNTPLDGAVDVDGWPAFRALVGGL
ncbi:5' nucleotidase, NT5C type [Desertimonas flava]|jgi:5'(3')-deoxyribonucleotidase|uniref:5' nucleotidase, NT5C type n=1 Tax=Desertimonas flava TaxID=2064846 RepID=UPI000E350B33|nr:hypothetical protein [Desertimonas flava]